MKLFDKKVARAVKQERERTLALVEDLVNCDRRSLYPVDFIFELRRRIKEGKK